MINDARHPLAPAIDRALRQDHLVYLNDAELIQFRDAIIEQIEDEFGAVRTESLSAYVVAREAPVSTTRYIISVGRTSS